MKTDICRFIKKKKVLRGLWFVHEMHVISEKEDKGAKL